MAASKTQLPKFPKFFQEILDDKGINNPEAIARFLYPRLDNLPHPKQILNMETAATAAVTAIEESIPIVLWGDYDVDGVTGTSLLYLFFRALGVTARWHVPDRFVDGYGVSIAAFDREFSDLAGQKFLFITVDCGISDGEAIAEIGRRGGRAIVSDHHHLPAGRLPPAIVINPQQEGCGLHGHGLAGVGIAFYLAAAIRAALRENDFFVGRQEPDLKKLLPLTAIGTLADISFISETNRILIRSGLDALQESSFPGLRVLLQETGIRPKDDEREEQTANGAGEGRHWRRENRSPEQRWNPITSEDVGFAIGPLLNAAGRLRHAGEAVRLLISDDERQARKVGRALSKINNERKVTCEENIELALRLLPPDSVLERQKTLVLAGRFHPGVAGIVAAQMVEKTGKATFILAQPGDTHGGEAGGRNSILYKGSGRSVPGIHLARCLGHCAALLDHHGGHAMAAGLSIKEHNIFHFGQRLEEAARMLWQQPVMAVKRPYQVSVETVMRAENLRTLSLLEPYGEGNPPPVFQSEEELVFVRAMGARNEHLQVLLRGCKSNHRAVGFWLGEKINTLHGVKRCLVRFAPIINRYRDTVSWQVRLLDICAVDE